MKKSSGRQKLIVGENDFKSWCFKNNRLDMLDEWDVEKNDGLLPNAVAYGSSRKIWWRGKECGHSYLASLNKRTSDKTDCPYCSPYHAKLLSGFNDLMTTNPELLDEWDYEKNGSLLPSMVMKGQHIKVWWSGKCGHRWLATPMHRIRGRGCPICADEARTSFPEQAIFFYLKKHFTDAENGNTKILGGKELDIFIPSINVAVEYDGGVWHKNIKRDNDKNKLCISKGITLFRIRDSLCPKMESSDRVKVIECEPENEKSLGIAIEQLLVELKEKPDVSFERDRVDIYNQYLAKRKEESLQSKYPLVSSEWDYESNGELTPDLVTAKSAKKVWWVGKCGHHWQATIHARTDRNAGCPYCAGKLLTGFNDLESVHPELLMLWSKDKNNCLEPSMVTCSSNQKVWWHCFKCGKDHEMAVYNKVKHPNSCPYCSNKKINKGVNDLETLNPQLAKEWDYEKNMGLLPSDVTKSSGKKVWWRCQKGHSYQATLYNRSNGRNCPICSGKITIKGVNDFATLHPLVLDEWDYSKNEKDPSEYSEHQRVLVWWKDKKGHSWQQTIEARSYGHGCPICNGTAKKKVMNVDTGITYNSLEDAAKSCGLLQGDTISLCCKGKQKKAGGYRWKFVD